MTEFSAVDLSEEEGMQWQAVDSSQISEIGYESGAEYPLGIKFPPNKKQQASGLPGSEYRYANVTPELYAQLLAAKDNPVYNNSIGTFFGKIIKAYADLYPFVKVEAERPTEPAAASVTIEASGTSKKKENPQPSLDLDGDAANGTISPSTSLSIIDTMADDLLFTPGAVTDAQLAAGRDWYLTEAKKYDISTEKARTELKRFARPLQKLRTGIEARAKELTGATKRKIAAIDEEKRRLVRIVGGIEDEVLQPLTAWEQEEETRKANLASIVARLAGFAQTYHPDIPTLTAAIAELESFDLSTMQEYKVGAESAIAASLRVLKPELERRKVAEANEAELARLRAEAAERAERDRLAAIERAAKERAERDAAESVAAAERERLSAEQRAEAAEAKAKADQIEAEQKAQEALKRADIERIAAVAKERLRIEDEQREERIAAEARAKNKAHRLKIDNEALGAIIALDIPMDRAQDLLIAIDKGLIPHVTIQY
jgi:hypothetical protein